MSLKDKIAKINEKVKADAGKPTADVAKSLYSKGPHIKRGPVRESMGYSIARACGLAAGKFSKEDCPEEVEVSNRLKAFFPQFSFGSKSAILVPFSTKDLPVYHEGVQENGVDSDRVKFVQELREKMLSTAEGADPDEMRALKTKSLTVGTDIDAGNLRGYPARAAEIIELQRAAEIMTRVGAREVTLGTNGLFTFAKQTGAAVAYMVNEEATRTNSQPTTGEIKLTAKKMLINVDVTNETMAFANPSAEALIRQDMAEVGARKVDQQCLYGTGSTTEVKGLLTYDTATSYVEGTDSLLLYAPVRTGTDGWYFLPKDVYAMLGMLPDQVDDNALSWVMRRKIYMALASRQSDAVSANDAAGPFTTEITRSLSDRVSANIVGNPVYYSQTVLANRTKGSSGATLSQAVVGKWNDFFLARFGVMTIETNNAPGWTTDLVSLRARQYFDAAPRHASSFVLFNDIING